MLILVRELRSSCSKRPCAMIAPCSFKVLSSIFCNNLKLSSCWPMTFRTSFEVRARREQPSTDRANCTHCVIDRSSCTVFCWSFSLRGHNNLLARLFPFSSNFLRRTSSFFSQANVHDRSTDVFSNTRPHALTSSLRRNWSRLERHSLKASSSIMMAAIDSFACLTPDRYSFA